MKRIETILSLIKKDCLDIQNSLTGLGKKEFLNNPPVNRAVCMSLFNIGGLVKTLPQDFCVQYPQLPWKKFTGMYNTARENKRLDLDAVWSAASSEIKKFLDFIACYENNLK